MCKVVEIARVEAERAHTAQAEVLLLPTAAGLKRPLDFAFPAMARLLAQAGFTTTVLEFEGQNGQPGAFSVSSSVEGLIEYVHRYAQKSCSVFGICTGAIAALAASKCTSQIASVFAWELAPRYEFTREAFLRLETKFGLKVDWSSALFPVQPIELLRHVSVPVTFGCSAPSLCTTLDEQSQMAAALGQARAIAVEQTSHVPGIPRNSETQLVTALLRHLSVMNRSRL